MMNMPLNLTPPVINPNAEKVLSKRYYRKDENGQCVEDATGLFWRVASSIAAEEAKYEQSPWKPDALARAFYDIMTDWRFLPNSPTLMNAGSELGQLSACFVLPVGDSIEEIFDAVKFAAMIHKSGGGTGFSFSRLRPKNSRVGTTGGVAARPGVLSAHLQHRHRADQAGRHPARREHGHPAHRSPGHPRIHPG